MFQSTNVMLFKATWPDLILHSSHWFTSGPSPHHPIISHWGFFHGLFLSLEEDGSNGVSVDHTVRHHIAPDSSLCSNGCENLSVTWLTCNSSVAEASHPQHMTAEFPQASHDQHTTAQVPKPHNISMWQLSPLSLTSQHMTSWVPQAQLSPSLIFKSVLEVYAKAEFKCSGAKAYPLFRPLWIVTASDKICLYELINCLSDCFQFYLYRMKSEEVGVLGSVALRSVPKSVGMLYSTSVLAES